MSTQPNRKRRGWREGAIDLLPDGRWRVRVSAGKDADGKRRRATFYARTKTDALAVLRREQSTTSSLVAGAEDLTVESWLARWLQLKGSTAGAVTVEKYEQRVRLHLNPLLGALRLRSLTGLDVASLLARMTARGASAKEQAKALSTLRTALADALKLRLIPHNPALDVTKPKAPPPDLWPLNTAQLAALLAAADKVPMRAYFYLAVDSGMRPGELFALHWPEVALDTTPPTIRVRQALEHCRGKTRLKEPKTPAARRTLAITARTAAILREHRDRLKAEGFDVAAGLVFPTSTGTPQNQSPFAETHFNPVRDAAGLPWVTPKTLRHSCATLLLAAGVDIKTVSQRLGHTSIATTLRTYTHVIQSMQERAIAALDGLLAESNGAQMGLESIQPPLDDSTQQDEHKRDASDDAR